MYKTANTAYNPASPIKSAEDAAALQQLVGFDMRFMVGCDNEWHFPEDDAQPANGAALPPVLPPSAADNDAARPAAAADAAASDPHDFTKWNMLEMDSIPFAQLKYDANNLAASRSAHAALIVFFLSDAMQRAHADAAQAINAGYQTRFQRPVTYADLRNFPSLGPNAYTPEEIKWCEATMDFLEGQLSDEARAVRSLPPAKRARLMRAAAAAAPSRAHASKTPPQKPPPQPRKTTPRMAADDDTEDDEDGLLSTPISTKRARKPRYMISRMKPITFRHIHHICHIRHIMHICNILYMHHICHIASLHRL
jgi:hypothetical protein